MTVSLLFSKKAGKIGTLQLDATIQETHDYTNSVTAYPVEEGFDITDNINVLPETLVMEGFVTNSPIATARNNSAEYSKVLDDGSIQVNSSAIEGFATNVENAFSELLRLSGRDTRGNRFDPELVTVITGLRVYQNMAIRNLNIPRNAATGQALRFNCDLIRVRQVDAETIELPNTSDDIKDSAQSTVAKDKVKTSPPTDKEAEEANQASLLFRGARAAVQGIGGLF